MHLPSVNSSSELIWRLSPSHTVLSISGANHTFPPLVGEIRMAGLGDILAGAPRLGDSSDQKEAPPPPPAIPLQNNALNTPTVYADAVWFAANLGNVVRIQFIENQLHTADSTTPGLNARYVGTLLMPRDGFKNMVEYLKRMDDYFDAVDAPSVKV